VGVSGSSLREAEEVTLIGEDSDSSVGGGNTEIMNSQVTLDSIKANNEEGLFISPEVVLDLLLTGGILKATHPPISITQYPITIFRIENQLKQGAFSVSTSIVNNVIRHRRETIIGIYQPSEEGVVRVIPQILRTILRSQQLRANRLAK